MRRITLVILRSLLKLLNVHIPFSVTMAIMTILMSCMTQEKEHSFKEALIDYVDPFIGTGGHGHTFPGATVPFGMVQLSPDNGVTEWDWCSGYHYSDSIIVGFSQTHLSGTGIGDLADVLMMPTTHHVDFTRKIQDRHDYDFKSTYSHDAEEASPGFYSVLLDDHNVKVSLTASTKCGLQQYDFPEDVYKAIVLDLSYSVNWDSATQTALNIVNDSLVTGYRYSTGWAKDQRIYFALSFSQPFKEVIVADSTTIIAEKRAEYMGRQIKSLFEFSMNDQETVLVKSGLSSASIDGALKSLQEIQDWDFDAARRTAEKLWEKELSKIKITDPDPVKKKIFYTAMYHSNLAPVIYADPNNEYKGAGGEKNKAYDYTRYDIFSLWDTYRAAHPLFTILQPERVNDMINSMLAHYDEYGLLPVWSLLGNETNTMTGYHAIPVIADAYFKGFQGFDISKAYKAMKASGMQDIRGVQYYKEYGYIPSDLEVESVTKNLEYAYDDWCIAQVAKDLGYEEDFKYFSERSESYLHLFDSTTGFMRGKMSTGLWREPFDAKRSEHRVNTDYTEGNAWQHTWYVPHDVQALIDLMGGKEAFIEKLDALFSNNSEITGKNISVDISGLIGQYAHGNEPSHHVAYLYNYANAPWKTQEKITEIMTTQYSDQPDGLCGNDDCGQMSAWYVFSALGFYPVNPASSIYVIGRPMFKEAEINLLSGHNFRIKAKNLTEQNIYIQSVSLNGKPYNDCYITHSILMEGGDLTFIMGPEPNKNWGISKEGIPNAMFNK